MDFDTAHFFERLRIEHTNFRSAVTHVKQAPVRSQAPALPGIGKFAQQMKIVCIVNKDRACFPRQLKDLSAQQCNAFTEEFWRQIDPLEDFSSFKTDFA